MDPKLIYNGLLWSPFSCGHYLLVNGISWAFFQPVTQALGTFRIPTLFFRIQKAWKSTPFLYPLVYSTYIATEYHHFLVGNIRSKGPFSIAMLVYRRSVYIHVVQSVCNGRFSNCKLTWLAGKSQMFNRKYCISSKVFHSHVNFCGSKCLDNGKNCGLAYDAMMLGNKHALPKTNKTLENPPFEDVFMMSFLLKMGIFQCHVSFQGCSFRTYLENKLWR